MGKTTTSMTSLDTNAANKITNWWKWINHSFYCKIPQLCAIPLWKGLFSTRIAYYADPNRTEVYPFYTIFKYTALQINNIVYMRIIWNSRFFFFCFFQLSSDLCYRTLKSQCVFCFPQFDKRHNRKYWCVLFREMFHLWEILSSEYKLGEHKVSSRKLSAINVRRGTRSSTNINIMHPSE